MKNNIKVLNPSFKSKKGFTLIEILLVITLLGLVASFFGGKIFSSFGRGQRQSARILVKKLEGDLDRFRLDCNFYPYTAQGLAALKTAPSSGRQCPNYDPSGYIDSVPKDPWGFEMQYTCDDGLNYEIKSLGADGIEGGEGDNADISSSDES
ncbi:type II secretion system major pseudopilin GspG [bacterium]|nr:type II secretion system major pseudopilin GspG [bacterium]